jgi:lipid-A-disaccharide synthase
LKRVFLVAGESSGDMHGANLIHALKTQMPDLEFEGLGGQAMQAEGMHLRHDLAGEAIMGFVEVLKHFPAIRKLFLETVAHIKTSRPDAVILIDYPGFNIRLAQALAGSGIPVIYYISPQVWAWKKKRIHTLSATVSKMLVIFPFEEALYQEVGLDCAYVGHPLIDHIAAYTPQHTLEGDPVIGILPGSRAQEIARLLSTMLEVAQGIQKRYPNARFYTPCVNEARATQIKALAGDFPLECTVGGMYDTLHAARFCLVASGTATLETALFGVPFIIMYKINPMSYAMARWLVKIDHIGMVNIIAEKRLVPEFVQHEAITSKILPVALELTEDSPGRESMITGLQEVRNRLGAGGASEIAASEILKLLQGKENA